MKNAVVTFALGYTRKEVELFLNSCKKIHLHADIILFAGKNHDALKEELQEYPDVILRKYEEPLLQKAVAKLLMKVPALAMLYAKLVRWMYQKVFTGKDRKLLFGMVQPLIHFMGKRFFALSKLMEESKYEKYLFTDIRDVVIQHDPFLACNSNELHAGAEPIYIGDDEHNKRWVDFTFERRIAESLYYKKVICAGVIYGSASSFELYLRRFIDLTFENLPGIINKLGADQAIHAYLFHYDMKGVNCKIHHNNDGKIVTLHHDDPDNFIWLSDQIIHPNGKMIYLVHQYDRHPIMDYWFRESLLGEEKRVSA